MEPGARPDRRHVRRLVDVHSGGELGRLLERRELLGVPLLHEAEAAELALDSVEVAMAVGVAGDEPGATEPVVGLHPLDDVHREAQPREPGTVGEPIGDEEARRRRVLDVRLRAQVVGDTDEQVRLLAAHQVQEAHRPAGRRRKRRRPDDARGAVAEEVDHADVCDVVERRQVERLGGAPAVPRLVEVELRRVAPEVDNVGRAGAVHVREAHARLIELVRGRERRRAVHRHLRAEAPVAEAGPVADRPVPDPDEVGEAVAGHVREVDRLGPVGEHEPRPELLVGRLANLLLGAVTRLRERGIPMEDLVTGQERVRVPVAGEVDEPQLGIVPVHVRKRREGFKAAPPLGRGAREEAAQWRGELHQVKASVAAEVEELLPAGGEVTGCGYGTEELGGGEARRRRRPGREGTEVALVVPSAGQLADDSGRSLTVEVGPSVRGHRQADRQILEALRVDVPHHRLDDRFAVAELDGHRRAAEIGPVLLPDVAGLPRGDEERPDRALLVAEVGRSDERVRRAELVGEVVEHEHAPAQAARPDLEAGPIDRERILTERPRPSLGRVGDGTDEVAALLVRRQLLVVALAVVEDHLEEPVERVQVRLDETRDRVSVPHPLQVAVRGPARVGAIALVRVGFAHAGRVLGGVLVDGGIAVTVVGLRDQPAVDVARLGGIGDPRSGSPTVHGGDVLRRDRPPVRVAVRVPDPALDAGEEPFDPGAVAGDRVAVALVDVRNPLPRRRFAQRRDEVLRPRQQVDVRLERVVVPWQALVRLPRDRGRRHGPPQAEGAVRGTRVVAQRELRAKPRATGRGGYRDAETARAGDRVCGELLADAPDRATALRERDRRWSVGGRARVALSHEFRGAHGLPCLSDDGCGGPAAHPLRSCPLPAARRRPRPTAADTESKTKVLRQQDAAKRLGQDAAAEVRELFKTAAKLAGLTPLRPLGSLFTVLVLRAALFTCLLRASRLNPRLQTSGPEDLDREIRSAD